MNSITKLTSRENPKALLSSLWIWITANYIYCDALTNMESVVLKDLLTGSLAGMAITESFLLMAGLLMEIPFVMIVLSRILPFRANRWANIIAGTIMIMVQAGTIGIGSPPTLHYIFFSIIEITGNALIVLCAVKWRDAEKAITETKGEKK